MAAHSEASWAKDITNFLWLNQKLVVTENYSEIIKKYILYRKSCLLFNLITGATAFITW